MKYSFDTSIFIEIHRKYPRDTHRKIWEIIENKLRSGEIYVSREVVEELKAGIA